MRCLQYPIKLQRFKAVIPLLSLILGACAGVGPDYQAPSQNAPQTWHTNMQDGLRSNTADAKQLETWWKVFDDPVLSQLITTAMDGNLGLQQAKARVKEARARRGISGADRFPTLDASGGVSNFKSSESTGSGIESELYTAGFDAAWELDLFGGVRRSVEVSEANLHASEADLQAVRVSLAAEVAINYLEVRTFQTRLNVAKANIKTMQKTSELINSRFKAGLSNELAVQQARYNLKITQSQIPSLRSGLDAAQNRLAILTGQPPGSLHEQLTDRQPIPVPPVSVAVGVPAETLRRRPDIHLAEEELIAQTARIGVATADLYPKFQLVGSIGAEALDADEFPEYKNRTWNIGPSFSWRIFNAGAIRQKIKVESAIQEQYLLAYEAAVLTALEEVENAMKAYVEEQIRREYLLEAVDAARKASKMSQNQYEAGLVDFSNVLDAQRSLLSYQDELAQSDGGVTSNLITLYKALGGGWEPLNSEKNSNE